MHNVQYSVYNVQYIVYNVECIVYYVQCIVYNVQCIVYNVQCTVYNVQCIVYTVQCTVYNVECIVYNVQCVPPGSFSVPGRTNPGGAVKGPNVWNILSALYTCTVHCTLYTVYCTHVQFIVHLTQCTVHSIQ